MSGVAALAEHLRTTQSWSLERLAHLRAALDPDGDGFAENRDWKALVDWHPESCNVNASPSESATHSRSASTALSTGVAEWVSEHGFFRGTSPRPKDPSKRDETIYFFRPVTVGQNIDSRTSEIFEECAARCVGMNDECWFFSIHEPTRGCSIHTKLFGFTSRSV